MAKIGQKTLLSLITFIVVKGAFALDSGTQNLTDKIGATDYYSVNCSNDSEHLNFKLFENSATTTPIEIPTIPSQLFNAKLTKSALTATVTEIIAGTSKEIKLKAGNGSYILMLDTFGTNLAIKTAQIYSVQYQCLNEKGKITKGSSTLTKLGIESTNKTLRNDKTAKYSITCSKDLINGNTSSLIVKLTNKTKVSAPTNTQIPTQPVAPSGNLTAQVIKGLTAKNTTGDAVDIFEGNGNYEIMVNSPINKALSYHFEYSCLNNKNVEATTSPFKLLQDQ